MNLHGWDTASIVSFDLINKALEESAQKLVTSFEFRDLPIQLKGRFGAWRVVRGGSLQRLHLQIPVEKGWIRGIDRASRTKIDGTIITVEIGLRLLPRADAPDTRDLVFDLDDSERPEDRAIRSIDIDVSNPKLSETQVEMTRLALTDCLNAHAEQIAFVFATIEARGTATDAWLQMPNIDFANVEPQGGPGYLAIMGARATPNAEMELDRFDTKLLDGHPPAMFAVSHSLYASGVVAPFMRDHFRPKANFVPASVPRPGGKGRVHGVSLKGAVTLPRRGDYTPVLKKLDIALDGAHLIVLAEAQVHVAAGCHLQVTMEMKNKFGLDPKTGRFSLRPVGKPVEKHWFDANNPIGWIVAAGATIVEWLVPALREQISTALTSIARQMESANNPLAQPRLWNGLRDFAPTRFQTTGCFWIADERPVEPLAYQMPNPTALKVLALDQSM